jgi:uncharacterized protein YggE
MERNGKRLAAAVAIVAVTPWIIATSIDRAPAPQGTIVSISGTGSAPQTVRLITIAAGVSTRAKTASAAMRENADLMAEVRAKLRRFGIADKDIRSVGLTLSPYDEPDHRRAGFDARHMLAVTFRDVEQSGHVLDTLVDAGATDIRGPAFSWEPGEQALDQARAAAVRDADRRADFFARALGMKIKRVVSMRDNGGYASGRPEAAAYAPRAGTEISPGEDVVRASVGGEYELVK